MDALLSGLITVLSVQALASPAVTRFEIMELPRLQSGNTFTNPMAINEAGQITGESGSTQISVGMHAFLWSPGKEMIDLDQGLWPWTTGMMINESAVMVGDATLCPDFDGACASQPLVFYPDGSIIELGPAYAGYLVITGINEQSMVIYNRASQSGANEPHLWTPAEGDIVLPTPDNTINGYAMDINDHGVIVGYSIGSGYVPHIWTDGTVASLEVEQGQAGKARSINNSGVIVGESTFSGSSQATRWMNAQAQPERLINDPEAFGYTYCNRIYDDGTIIGTWKDSQSRVRPFRIAPDGTVDLFSLPEIGLDTLDLIPVESTPEGWLICSHVNEFYQVEPVVWIPGEGWIFTNTRLVGPGSNTSEQPVDCNSHGQIITRGASWTSPSFLNPMPPGDVDGDGLVGVNDLLGVLESYGQCNQTPSRLCPADVNADNQVNVNDVLGVIDNWLY
ncbi:MAG: hypothetical protein CMJ39_12835 [Phycisphaerae bacterium]|nr:hypothetical protein [Phycisphaerae bacterium]